MAPRLSAPPIVACIVVPFLLLVPDAGGQSVPSLGSEGEVGATLSGRSGVTWIGMRAVPLVALAGTFRLSPHVEIGGEGVLSVRPLRISPAASPDRFELSTGYGGMLVRWTPSGDMPGVRWRGSLHLGAGTARVRSVLLDSQIASQNFLVLEPGVHALFRQTRTLRFSLDGSFRIATPTDRVPGIEPGDLRGPTLSLTIQIVHDP